MSSSDRNQEQKIQAFIDELSAFAKTAEDTLSQIQEDMEGKKGLFSVFSQRMLAIRGTAVQLSLPHIAHIAELSEEIAIKGVGATSRPQIRKCVGSLWDALTTVKYMLEHHAEKTGEEQDILIRRLQATLNAFGGARPKLNENEIEELFKQRS